MAKLYRTTVDSTNSSAAFVSGQADLLIEHIELAHSFVQRGIGLLGRKSLDSSQALWIKPGNNCHTFFMKFTIDCIFVDRALIIRKLVPSVKPFRVIGPYWKAFSFFETAEGSIAKWSLKEGDQLYVVD